MSCLLDEIAQIKNFQENLEWLCPHLIKSSNRDLKKDEVVPWDIWEDNCEDLADDSELLLKSKEIIEWLNECIVEISPFIDLMVIACKNRLMFLNSVWEKNENGDMKEYFITNWKGIVGSHDQDEITSIICLPIISQKQSSTGSPDWTSIAVGFRSGYISFYTEIFENRPALNIYCRTYIPKNFGACFYSDLSEELIILYPKAVVSIDGFSLMQTLKACRNQVAKAAAHGEECLSKYTALSYKKWSLSDQEKVFDCVASGMLPPHLYDQIMYQSCSQGFNQSISSSVPSTSQILTVGKVPYVGILGIKEGSVQPFMADIAIHYASKIKDVLVNAAAGWLFGKQHASPKHPKRDEPKIEQATPASFRYAVPDFRRVGLSIKLSTSRRLAAVTDDFGRVTLMDVQKCLVLRMFKGYRDAECGWVTSDGEWENKRREVPFLIIYAPRRNIVEVWLPQQGPRIAAFNIPQNASGKTSKQSKDIHLLKTLKRSLQNDSEEEVLKIISEIQTDAIKLQVLSLIIASRFITESLAHGLIKILCPSFNNEGEEMNSMTNHESKLLVQQLKRLKQLLHFYSAISDLHSNTPLESLTKEEIEMKLRNHLLISEEEQSYLISNLHDENLHPAKSKHVTFGPESKLTFSSFLHCWEITVGIIEKETASIAPIHTNKKMSEEKEKRLSGFLFGWSFRFAQIGQICKIFCDAGLNYTELLHLAFVYWLNLTSIDELATLQMSFIILMLSLLSEPELVSDPSNVNPYWEHMRGELSVWCRPMHTFTAALVCKGVEAATLMYSKDITEEIQQSIEIDEINVESYSSQMLNKLYVKLHEPTLISSSIPDASYEEFEGLSLEMVEWNLMLDKCRKLLPVQKLYNVISKRGVKLEPEFSVQIFITKGKGYLSELVCKWLSQLEVKVEVLVRTIEEAAKIEVKNSSNEEQEEMMEISLDDQEDWLVNIQRCLSDITSDFPESMKSDVLILNLALEFGSLWKKEPSEVDNLKKAVVSLGTIKNSFLKHGLGIMIWETWVVYHVQLATQLIDKHRRVPRERISIKEIGISEFKLHPFFCIAKELVEIIISDRAAIFKPLFCSWRATSDDASEVVNGAQLSFLTRVISAAVVALPDTSSSPPTLNIPSGLYDCVELGRTWGITVDTLRRHYVCELYSSGLDSMAEQSLVMVRDGELMASQMIVIAGQRLQYLITSHKKALHVIGLITPPVKEWCKSLDSGCLRSPDQQPDVTFKMIHKALNLLSENSSHYKLASNLYRVFDMINNSGVLNQEET